MTARKRRDPKLPGVAGITSEDLAALDAKRVTLQDLADRCGISKQGAAKRIARMRAASPAATSPAPTSTGPAIPADAIMIDPHRALVSANLGILSYVNATLESGAALGPSAVKSLASAVTLVRSELMALGILAAPDDAETPTEFVIRVLSDDEHDRIKASVELPDED